MQRLLKNRKDGITLPALLQKEDFKIIKIKEKNSFMIVIVRQTKQNNYIFLLLYSKY